tara:strand:- start:4549 stop:5253 length:705 start_codon:yes stop_codon:yes gene_type:complete
MKGLAIVPARGGSKRLPRKNLKMLGGKPLVQHTLDAALDSNIFSKIILTSDDEEILEIGRGIEGITAEKRNPEHAKDTAKALDLVLSIVSREEIQNEFDFVALLLPTCPFRDAKDISDGFKLLTTDFDSVVCITEMGDPIQLSVGLDEDSKQIDPNVILNPSPLITGNTRSQDFQKYYRANGGFYMSWTKSLLKNKNYFKGKVKGHAMDPRKMIDIDYESDFKLAEFIYNNVLN